MANKVSFAIVNLCLGRYLIILVKIKLSTFLY